jgi:hypothetical protein
MNLTKSQSVRRFFFDELMPLAAQFRARGEIFFPLSANPSARTYYTKRDKTAMTAKDFEVAGCDAVDSFEEALTALWNSQGYPQLTSLAPTLSRLARSFHHIDQQNEEVSPFIYVMF